MILSVYKPPKLVTLEDHVPIPWVTKAIATNKTNIPHFIASFQLDRQTKTVVSRYNWKKKSNGKIYYIVWCMYNYFIYIIMLYDVGIFISSKATYAFPPPPFLQGITVETLLTDTLLILTPRYWGQVFFVPCSPSLNSTRLQCDYCNRGHLEKVEQSDYRKITIHSKKVGCGLISRS